MSCTALPETVASTLYLNYCHKVTVILHMMHNQKSVTLHCHSYSMRGTERVAAVLALNGGYYHIYRCLQPITSCITPDVKTKVIDDLLTLIFRIGY
jgi:hypothetical protein